MVENKEFSEKNEEEVIAIVGMGPGGLVSAIEILRKNANKPAKDQLKIIIFEKREHFTRGQKVALDKHNIEYLENLMKEYGKKHGYDDKDITFMHSMMPKGVDGSMYVDIAQLQEFLKRKLLPYTQGDPPLLQIKQDKDLSISAINTTQHKLQYVDKDGPHSILFKHLIAADGARHETATLAFGTKTDQHFENNPVQLRQEVHGTINLRIHNFKATEHTIPPKNITINDFETLIAAGWDQPYLPKVYCWPDATGNLYIAGEVPSYILKLQKDIFKEIEKINAEIELERKSNNIQREVLIASLQRRIQNLEEKPQKELEKWGKVIAQLHGYEEVSLNLYHGEDEVERQKSKLQATVFGVTLKNATQGAYDCASPTQQNITEHAIVQVGDAGINPNFHLSHGANFAIMDGKYVAACITDTSTGTKFHLQAFNTYHQHKKNLVSTGTKTAAEQDHAAYSTQKKIHIENLLKLSTKIKTEILPYIKEKEKFLKKLREIDAALKEEAIDENIIINENTLEIVPKAEAIFNDIHQLLIEDTEQFLKPLTDLKKDTNTSTTSPNLKQDNSKLPKFCKSIIGWLGSFQSKPVKVKQEVKPPLIDSKETDSLEAKEIQSKLAIMYQFKIAAESIEDLEKLSKLKPGERPPSASATHEISGTNTPKTKPF